MVQMISAAQWHPSPWPLSTPALCKIRLSKLWVLWCIRQGQACSLQFENIDSSLTWTQSGAVSCPRSHNHYILRTMSPVSQTVVLSSAPHQILLPFGNKMNEQTISKCWSTSKLSSQTTPFLYSSLDLSLELKTCLSNCFLGMFTWIFNSI